MQHLILEELARLVDEAPSPAEAAHLAECEGCAEELRTMTARTASLRALPDPKPPARLRERVLTVLASEDRVTTSSSRLRRALPRIAAGLALFLAGGVGGAYLAPAATAPRSAAEPPAVALPTDAAGAARLLESAEAEYLQALGHFAEVTGSADSFDPIDRLAALEGIVLTTGAALRTAPADPIINNYHLTALGQRDALLRRLRTVTLDEEWF